MKSDICTLKKWEENSNLIKTGQE